MIIKYYDKNYKDKFSCKQVCTKCKSIIWTKLFYDVGNFEITEPTEIPEIGDIIVHGPHCGIVCRIFDSNQSVKVYGYDLKGLLNFRYLTTYLTDEEFVEKIIKDIATETLCVGKRTIKGLEIEPVSESTTDKVSEEYVVANIKAADAIKNLSSTYEIGWDITFQEDKLTFSTKKGADLSEQIVFSKKFRNVEKVEYENSIFDSANTVYGDESVHFENEEPEGINRLECGLTDSNSSIEEFLKSKKPAETIKGTANEKMIYGEDYNIGDYVTVMHNNISTVKQITKVEFVYEPCNSKIIPTFGDIKENILKKIARKV